MTSLREQVARAIAERDRLGPDDEVWRDQADAAIGVVLGVIADEIKALQRPHHGRTTEGSSVANALTAYHNAAIGDVLAVVERLRG